MMGIGFSELVVIVLVVLIFIRPDDLPAFFRKLGKIYAELKKGYDELTAVKDDFIREMEAAAKIEEEEPPSAALAEAQPSRTAPGPDVAGSAGTGPCAPPESPPQAEAPGEGLAQSGKPL